MPAFFYQGQKILDAEPGLGEVWLSGYHFAQNNELLRKNNIKAIVSAVDLGISYDAAVLVHALDLRDSEDEEVRFTFFPVFRFIEQERKKGNVLVHCAAGISRSATLLLAYTMNKYRTTLDDAFSHALRRRPCLQPNKGFLLQLRKFQTDLGIPDGARHFQSA
jgi:dual specificity MAP kinase phosphatase